MIFRSWLRTWQHLLGSSPCRARRPRRRLQLEQLEDRTTPSANLGFALRMGGTNVEAGLNIAVDSAGNIYTTGIFMGTVDFDPGPGTYNLTSAGDGDVFVTKLTSAGNLVWARHLGGPASDRGYGIAVDGAGNVYTTGFFMWTADFDPGAGTSNLTDAGGADVFVSKLDSGGNFVWARRFGGTREDMGYGIAVDGAGNVYTTGFFQDTADLDPGPGTADYTSAGFHDVFVSKLDRDGNFVWAKQFGDAGWDIGYDIAVDGAGNVHTTGFFQGTVDFDPDAGTYNLTCPAGSNVFVSKLNSDGNFVWAAQLGGTGGDQGKDIAVDSTGNVYTTGFFNSTADFDPGPGTYNLTSAGNCDAFVSKLDSGGNFLWARQLGGLDWVEGNGIAVDSAGNIYTTGYFKGTADFDPDTTTYNLASAGDKDVFVTKLTNGGDFVWSHQFSGTSDEEAHDIVVDNAGNVYTTGYFYETVDFDPGAGTFNLTSAGFFDTFVSKLTQQIQPPQPPTPPTPTTQVPVVGDWNGNGRDKIGVFRNGQWILDSNGSGNFGARDWVFAYGRAGDTPVVGDWNGDGRDDIGVFRNGQWILDRNGSRRFDAFDWVFAYGRAGDKPVVGDWNGDGRDDIGVFRNGQWILDRNSSGRYDVFDWAFVLGRAGDIAVVGDWNGDGRDDVGVFRNGRWYLCRTVSRSYQTFFRSFAFGRAGDIPLAGDWSSSSRGKIGIFRNGRWILDSNGSGGYEASDWVLAYG